MRSTVFALAIYLISLSTCFGQSQPATYGDYVETLSHLKGVAVAVGHRNTSGQRDAGSKVKSQVQAKIQDARGVRLYTEEGKEEFERSEESRPVLTIQITTFRESQSIARSNPELAEASYEVELTVEQDVTIQGTEKELRRDTYAVYGDATRENYNTVNVDPVKLARRATVVMVDQFIRDFREAKSN